jgi:hypothetical protein
MTEAYYIYAPRYVPTSAGIRALYILARELRNAGYPAWIVTYAEHEQNQLPPEMADMVLDYETAITHDFSPIVVYPETLHGNPLRAQAVVRYVMNVPGLLGGPDAFGPTDCIYAFSETIAEKIGLPDWSLFMALVDETRFVPADVDKTLTCIYASKYRNVHSGTLDLPEGAIEISRDLQNSPDQNQLLDLLQRAKRLYIYENTALAIEAALCNCVVIFVPNPYLEFSIGALDHGNAGMAWGETAEEIARAEATVGQFRQDYTACRERFPERLRLFIERTLTYRRQVSGNDMDWSIIKPLDYAQQASLAADRMLKTTPLTGLVAKAVDVLKRRGLRTTVAIVLDLVKRARRG